MNDIPKRKKVAFCSNYCGAKTGFGGFMREILSYLYKTGKYDLTLYAAGMTWNHGDFERWPWKVYGTLPTSPAEIDRINRDPNLAREANYGGVLVDNFVHEVQPDAMVMVEDPWGFASWTGKNWWGKIPCVVHTTLDSRPILSQAVDIAKTTPYFFTWAEFAAKEMRGMGLSHVKTLRGSVQSNIFRRLASSRRQELRAQHGIPEGAFCFGMLSRNQLRKSFPNIISAYAMFREKNPGVTARLLFFTHYGEGWNIPALIAEHKIDPKEVLATYKCRQTGRYYVRPFEGQDLDNPETGAKKSLVTVNVQDGLTEEQVNEWYNLLDVYVHAFTSGGQERSIQEAKLAELITLVTNYSCGEDACDDEAASLPLDYDEYREPGTQFIKATTKPFSIVKQLEKVLRMDEGKRREMGRQARAWALKNFSIDVIGKQFEEILDALPPASFDFSQQSVSLDPDAAVPPIEDSAAWVKSLYKQILKREVADDDSGLLYWLQALRNNSPRAQVEEYFRHVVREDRRKTGFDDLSAQLGPEDPENRVLISMPESLGDCMYLTSLLRDARELYAGKVIYVATKSTFMDLFQPLVGQYIDKVLPWRPDFDNAYLLEGAMGQKKYFQVMLNPHFPTQRMINYLHNASDVSALNLEYTS